MQRELFSTPMDVAMSQPTARTSDPETSALAGEAMTRSGKRENQALRVLDLVFRYPGSTSLELAERGTLNRYQIARRLPELEGGQMIRKGSPRLCKVAGTLAVTWWRTQ